MFVPTLHYHGEDDEDDAENDGGLNELQRFMSKPVSDLKDQPGDEGKMRSYAGQYVDVGQDEDADYYRLSKATNPHWDHEIYMMGVAPDERFGRKAMIGTQAGLDEALRNMPQSYAKVIGREQAMPAFPFRRMVGRYFENEDIQPLRA